MNRDATGTYCITAKGGEQVRAFVPLPLHAPKTFIRCTIRFSPNGWPIRIWLKRWV
jgi:hypothetical protein